MKAVWTVGGILGDKCDAVDFVADLGFDTMVTGSVSPDVMARAREREVQVVTNIFPFADDDFKRDAPHALQKVRDYENQLAKSFEGQDWENLTAGAYRWHPILLARDGMCFEHEETKQAVRARIEKALSWADGIALDGFGFMNYYACFCDRCEAIWAEMKAKEPDKPDLDILVEMSTQTLVDIHEMIYDFAKSVDDSKMVTDHVWPPFRPDEYIGHKFKLDYCTQTISWFYPPEWRLERVAFEAAEMKRLEDTSVNRFVPFIGIYDTGGHVRSAERLAKELEIALTYGENRVVVSRLTTLQQHTHLADVVKKAFEQSR
ncbi:MAG: hypothetical protein ACO36I_02280 [Candidatus Latescibacterota bacterium]|jgi:hypothetical protein